MLQGMISWSKRLRRHGQDGRSPRGLAWRPSPTSGDVILKSMGYAFLQQRGGRQGDDRHATDLQGTLGRRGPMVTITDVAKAAGVSVSTVSHVV
ncbi:MAG: LacI family DNA-binding transcriptional regulator, partial [Halomonas sp. BM-2019]